MRVAMYLRSAIDPTGGRKAIDRQREDCLALCDEQGWTPVEYAEVSPTTGPRWAYQAMLTDLAAGQLDGVVAWHTDRLYRTTRGMDELLRTLNGRPVATVEGAL